MSSSGMNFSSSRREEDNLYPGRQTPEGDASGASRAADPAPKPEPDPVPEIDPLPRDARAPEPQVNEGAGSLFGAQINNLTVALIGPDEYRREHVALEMAACGVGRVREFPAYPPSLDDSPRLLSESHDVIVIEIDSDPESALDLVEHIASHGSTTVIVYSISNEPELLVRCMRAGAREFLTLPVSTEAMAEALVRTAARRSTASIVQSERKNLYGKLLAFMGAKGGAGVTTIACNFAVALAQNRSKKTLLIDLDLPLGDAALDLGITPQFSAIDALQSSERLDEVFLCRLVTEHHSGLFVLAAPGRVHPHQPTAAEIDKLLTTARRCFDYVVVDTGSNLDWTITASFGSAHMVYLVTQAGVPELRNANRLIAQLFANNSPKLEVVINRYEALSLKVPDAEIERFLTRQAKWKIPNDYAVVKQMQINAEPLALADSSVARQIRSMAGSIDGDRSRAAKKTKKGFSLFGW